MNNLIIIGSGGHARPVIEICANQGVYCIKGIIDLNYGADSDSKESILGVNILGSLSTLAHSNCKTTALFIAIGDNQEREKIAQYTLRLGFHLINVIHPSAIISKTAVLQDGIFIGPNSHIGQCVSVGKGVIVNTNANIEHESIIGDFSHLAPSSIICGRTLIGEKCFIGANTSVIEKIRIANCTTIRSGAVVTKDITLSGQTHVGVPAQAL